MTRLQRAVYHLGAIRTPEGWAYWYSDEGNYRIVERDDELASLSDYLDRDPTNGYSEWRRDVPATEAPHDWRPHQIDRERAVAEARYNASLLIVESAKLASLTSRIEMLMVMHGVYPEETCGFLAKTCTRLRCESSAIASHVAMILDLDPHSERDV